MSRVSPSLWLICFFRGLILQDLTFVHLGNPDLLTTPQGSKVNFSKCCQQFNILDTLRSYQQVWATPPVCSICLKYLCVLRYLYFSCRHYSLQPDEDIISFFNDFSDHLAEEALWELSLKIRPKNTPRTNQRWAVLKQQPIWKQEGTVAVKQR